jgi:competence protein ComEA
MHRTACTPFLTAAFLIVAALALAARETPVVKLPSATTAEKAKAKTAARQVDLNNASKEELKKIPGITDELAARIIAGRPYRSKADLVTHKVLPMALYQSIKDQVSAKQKHATK